MFTDPDFPGNKIRQTIMQAVPTCAHAYLPKKEAIAKNDKGVGVEHASADSIKRALQEVITPKVGEVEVIETEFLLALGLIGYANSAKRRERLSEVLGIGYVNGKQLQKRLIMFGVTKQQVVEALKEDLKVSKIKELVRMRDIATKSNTREIIERHGFTFKKVLDKTS